jgi:molybdate transport system ATP-binding protein
MRIADKVVPERNSSVDPRSTFSADPVRGGVLEARLLRRTLNEDCEFVLDVEFAAAPGFTILFGPSGAGKTTLLDCLAGLAVPQAGQIKIGDQLVFDSALRVNLPTARRRVGYVFQDLALFPHLTVEQNVHYGLVSYPRQERRRRTATILDSFNISALASRHPKEVSGGERQRVALARTLVTDPELLLLDEPLAALDLATKSKIIDDLRSWNAAHNIPILYVTHNRDEVFALGERSIVLDSGRIIEEGTPHQVLDAPRLETVAQLAGFENIFDATVACRVAARYSQGVHSGEKSNNAVILETPLVRADVGAALKIGIRAGDILLSTVRPVGLSARNIIPGRLAKLETRDVIVSGRVECGVEMEVHMTLAARDSLQLAAGLEVWLVIKTHSCHLMK